MDLKKEVAMAGRRVTFADQLRMCDHERAEMRLLGFNVPEADRAPLERAARLANVSQAGLLRLGLKMIVAEIERRYGNGVPK